MSIIFSSGGVTTTDGRFLPFTTTFRTFRFLCSWAKLIPDGVTTTNGPFLLPITTFIIGRFLPITTNFAIGHFLILSPTVPTTLLGEKRVVLIPATRKNRKQKEQPEYDVKQEKLKDDETKMARIRLLKIKGIFP
ncbi:hypothetical protein V6N13_037552 [Hibiscus sabdariffa]|uniref:Uncharacterized protein n=1 Tax=Hibiscus sabdariffa TaxID=183260 RepID=A0ABR2S575_9ROSI